MNRKTLIITGLIAIFALLSCNQTSRNTDDEKGKLNVVATTTMVADLVSQVGGDHVKLNGLMGPGVDPHLYKASEGDVSKLYEADIIFYNGLHLEGKMVDLFEKMNRSGKNTFAVAEAIPGDQLLKSEAAYAQYDPHIWFDILLWKEAAKYVAEALLKVDPAHQTAYLKNLKQYQAELDTLLDYSENEISMVPENQRVLITAHDAFEYFGRAFEFEVKGLQGISTVSEAGAADVKDLADFIARRKIPAIFVETSVPRRNITALNEAVRARGFEVKIGGELFSDALGSPGTDEGTYIGMYRHNIKTITDALK